MFTTIFHYQATDADSNPMCVCARAYVCVCVKIMGDNRVAVYLVDTNTHVNTHLRIIIISAKISID